MKRIALPVANVSFLVSLVLLPAAWLLAGFVLHFGQIRFTVPWHAAFVMVPPALLVLCAWLTFRTAENGSAPKLLGKRFVQKVSLAIASTFIFFLATEQVLQLIGYEQAFTPLVVLSEGNTVSPTDKAVVSDPELLWRFNPGATFLGRRVNKLGHLDREIDFAKTPGTIRVICMGDSVTGQGTPPYSGYLNTKLTKEPPTTQPWESFNMGVHGYSSVQGLQLFNLRGRLLKPDIVTIYYGWNDHWLSDRPDSTKMAVSVSPFQRSLRKVLENKRFGQLLIHMLHPRQTYTEQKDSRVCRVPADEYRSTLEQFVTAIRAAGAVPVLITAPRGNLTPLLVRNGAALSIEEACRLHDLYVGITRDIARENKVSLLDLCERFSRVDAAPPPQGDGIHFGAPGLARIGHEIHAHLSTLTATDEWKNRAEEVR